MSVDAEVYSQASELLTIESMVEGAREEGWSVRFLELDVRAETLKLLPTQERTGSADVIGWHPESLADELVDGLIRAGSAGKIEELCKQNRMGFCTFDVEARTAEYPIDPEDVAAIAEESGQMVADLVRDAKNTYTVTTHSPYLPTTVELQDALQRGIWRVTEGLMQDGNYTWHLWGQELPPPETPEHEGTPYADRLIAAIVQGMPLAGQIQALIEGSAALKRAKEEDACYREEVEFVTGAMAMEEIPSGQENYGEIPFAQENYRRELIERGAALAGSVAGCLALWGLTAATHNPWIIFPCSWAGGFVGNLLCSTIARRMQSAREARLAKSTEGLFAAATAEDTEDSSGA